MIDTQNKIIEGETALLRIDDSMVLNGYTIKGINLAAELPHTMRFAGRTGLIIDDCNIYNCDFPEGTIIKDNCAWKGVHIAPEPEQPIIEETPLPDLQETVNNALILAENKTVEFSQTLKETAGIEKIVGLVNASEGAKVEVVE